VLANIPVKYRSTLRSIQLGLLCNAGTVKEYGYEKVMQPLVKDLVHLEQSGLFIDQLGSTVKGTVLYVSADNLGAHSMAGFLEGFTAERFCRFCMSTRTEAQHTDVGCQNFEPRTKDSHNRHVEEVKQDPSLSKLYGVKGSCPLTDTLQHFHAVTGYPPDILHDLLEGIVPAELCLCLSKLIDKKYISLESVNHAVKTFAYTFSDKTNRPQPIPKAFATKRTIGGNGHENWTLLRLLPLLIGDDIPEGDSSWEILMLLKDIVELAVASKHTEESIDFLRSKIKEHRELLQSTFPGFTLKPKHHFVEHYPQMIKAFGPLSDVWTMRFEGKHKFFKKVIRDSQNFKNVALTLAVQHQRMMAYYLDSSSFFRPPIEISKVKSALVTSFPDHIQQVFHQMAPQLKTVLIASSVTADGVEYHADMVISAGSLSGLPEFKVISQIVAVNSEVLFVCKPMSAWYIEHIRSYELCSSHVTSLCVIRMSELNEVFPLSCYIVKGRMVVTPKRYIFC